MPIFEEEISSPIFGDSKFDLDMKPIYDSYDDDYKQILGFENHLPHKREPKLIELQALENEDSKQQLAIFDSLIVAKSEETMFLDMVVVMTLLW
ncbi:hypothetical protein M0R45_028815 [Rubus argutus]|uniref:Uncharacterized protein n=1 Tax=Rubus argutus TaxID=59490 RepID=A0AAW1W6D9_RUBAR